MNIETQLNSKLDEDDLIAKSWEILQPEREGKIYGTFMSYRKEGKLSWGKQAHEAMGSPSRVELMINREKKAIGLRPVDEGGFVVATNEKSSPTVHTFSCKNTLKTHGLYVETGFRREYFRMGTMVYVIAPELFG